MQFHRGENAIFEVSRGRKTTKNGSSRATWPDLGLTWAHLASHGPTRGQLGPTWGQLGAYLEPTWGQFGPPWDQFGLLWGPLGSTWAGLARLGPARGQSGPKLGPCWGQLGPILGLILGQLGFNLAPTAVQQTAESAVRNHWPKGLFETAPGQTHQRTCQTSCSSRAATVERLIMSRSTTYSSPDDSFERWVELSSG